MLSIIAAIGKNRELGKDNKLLWDIPEDMENFRKITAGHPVIMGRTTYQSIGHPLPNRTNIVISGNPEFSQTGITVVRSLDEAIETAKNAPRSEEIFVIGGASVYLQAMNHADKLYLTIVDATADADTFFPDYSRFHHIVSKKTVESTSGYTLTFQVCTPNM